MRPTWLANAESSYVSLQFFWSEWGLLLPFIAVQGLLVAFIAVESRVLYVAG